jgi:hypothetical protein
VAGSAAAVSDQILARCLILLAALMDDDANRALHGDEWAAIQKAAKRPRGAPATDRAPACACCGQPTSRLDARAWYLHCDRCAAGDCPRGPCGYGKPARNEVPA